MKIISTDPQLCSLNKLFYGLYLTFELNEYKKTTQILCTLRVISHFGFLLVLEHKNNKKE